MGETGEPQDSLQPARSKAVFTVQALDEWKPETSKFWMKVKSAGKPEIEAALHGLVNGADHLGNLIVQELPTFTRHDHVHMENVLYWMDQFVTQEGLNELGVSGCALCIVLAYVHDLGMLPGRGWKQRVQAADSKEEQELREWAAAHHPDLLDLEIECAGLGQTGRVQWIRTFLQRDFLRDTHATGGDPGRIVDYLELLESESPLKDVFAFLGPRKHAIELMAKLVESHSRPVDWFARGRFDHGYKHVGRPDEANVVLASLLLRLADIADFDCSRTPPIYFRQLGIDGLVPLLSAELPPEQVRPAEVTVQEWTKHLAVERWLNEGGDLVYVAPDCPNPAVERSIRHFCAEIKRECKDAAAEIERVFSQAGAAWLCLPDDVRCKVTPRDYVYADVSFRLEAHKVTQLLMGTALYGRPELCVRELLQNALDSVQLRDLRWRLRERLEKAEVEAPEDLPPVETWKEKEREQPIFLEWGTREDGREWVSVKDAGTGMTKDQVERYFAALGRSFYGSLEFEREARLMREHGLVASPISQFGIGVLSSFMVAESIEIRTCTCAYRKADREAWKVKITGPGSLFHFTPLRGQDIRPGTELRLLLKRDFRLRELSLSELLEQLKAELGYTKPQGDSTRTQASDGVTWFNPAAVAARHVIWPRYPIVARKAGESEPLLTINDQWHFTDLVPLRQDQLLDAAKAWKLPDPTVHHLRWRTLDWVDDTGPDATGSRVRVVCPSKDGQLPHWSLLAIAETQLDGCKLARDRILVRGMHVDRIDDGIASLVRRASAGLGAYFWIDFAGKAAPSLTADRKNATPPTGQGRQHWELRVEALLNRWFNAQAKTLATSGTDRASFRTALLLDPTWNKMMTAEPADKVWRLSSLASDGPLRTDVLDTVEAVTRAFDLGRHRLLERQPTVSERSASEIELQVGLARVRNAKPSSDPDPTFNNYRDLLRGFTAKFAGKLDHPAARELGRTLFVNYQYECRLGRILADNLACTLLNEGLADNFPPLQIPTAIGVSQEATHLAPTVLKGAPLAPSEVLSADLASMNFDLIFPFPAIATPPWQRQFPTWGRERGWRHILTFPFFVDAQERELPVKIAHVLRVLRHSGRIQMSWLSSETVIHALIPRVELWDRNFDQWAPDDLTSCGYSAQWNLGGGELLWAVGAVPKAEMDKAGLPLDKFCESPKFLQFRKGFPSLF